MDFEKQTFEPTLDDPTSDHAKKYQKSFDNKLHRDGVTLKEDIMLNEKEQSLKKKIFDLSKMEALVHGDQMLSPIYNKMAEDGDEKYGYHYNETIMNLIFNEYVLNSQKYLQKYKQAIPKDKERRDKTGIHKLQAAGEMEKDLQSKRQKLQKSTPHFEPKQDEAVLHNNSLPGVVKEEPTTSGNFGVVNGFGYDQERDGNNRNQEYYNTMKEPIEEHHLNTREEKIDFILQHTDKLNPSQSQYPVDDIGGWLNGLGDEALDNIYNNVERELGMIETATASGAGQYSAPMGTVNRKFVDMSESKKKTTIDEKAESKSQQRFMGMVRAAQKGELDDPSPSVAKAAKEMKTDDVEDFASTKHKGLPEKVKTDENINEEELDETSTTGSVGGQYTTKLGTDGHGGKAKRHPDLDKPAWEGGEIIGESNYITDPSGFKKYVNEMDKSKIEKPTLKEGFDMTDSSVPTMAEDGMKYSPDKVKTVPTEMLGQALVDLMRLMNKYGSRDSKLFGISDDVEQIKNVIQNRGDKQNLSPEAQQAMQNKSWWQKMFGGMFGEGENMNEEVGSLKTLKDFIDKYNLQPTGNNGKYRLNDLTPVLTNPIDKDDQYDLGAILADKVLGNMGIGWDDLPDINSIWDAVEAGHTDIKSFMANIKELAQERISDVDSEFGGMFGEGTGEDIGSALGGAAGTAIAKNPVGGAVGSAIGGAIGSKFDEAQTPNKFAKSMDAIGDPEKAIGGLGGEDNPFDAPEMNIDARIDADKGKYGDKFGGNIGESIIDQPPVDDRDPTSMKMKSTGMGGGGDSTPFGDVAGFGIGEGVNEDVASRTKCKSDEEPVAGKRINEPGGCKKTDSYQREKEHSPNNLEARRKRMAKKQQELDKKKKSYNDELEKNKNKMSELKEGMNEDKKPSALVMKDRLGKENEANFKKDFKDSNTADIKTVEDDLTAKEQISQVGDPFDLGKQIEKDHLDALDDSFKNVGNSANEEGDEIPKRNLSNPEQEEINMMRYGMQDWIYDNEPSERFEERMKEDMGEELYAERLKKMKYKADAPMYNKDTQPVDDAQLEKDQFDKDSSGWNQRDGTKKNKRMTVGESVLTGKYKDDFGNVKLVNFKLNEVIKGNGEGKKMSLEGMGNSFTNRVHENTEMRNIMDNFEFYMNGDNKVTVKKVGKQMMNESTNNEKEQVNEQMIKMKKLMGYDPSKHVNTKNVKKNRNF